MADRVYYFRRNPGRPFLTDDQVREIRRLYKAGHRGTKVARKFKISLAYFNSVGQGKSRKGVASETTN